MSDNLTMFHFGIYPVEQQPVTNLKTGEKEPTLSRASVQGHTSTTEEFEIDLGPASPKGLQAWVSGSWGCWGAADQSDFTDEGGLLEQSEGDFSLHVVFASPPGDVPPDTAGAINIMYSFLKTVIGETDRVLDYGIVTTEDHSEVLEVVTFLGNPFLVGYKNAGVTYARSRDIDDEDYQE